MKPITTIHFDLTFFHIGVVSLLIFGTMFIMGSEEPPANPNENAARVLKSFADKIKDKLTGDQIKEFKTLANIPVPIAGLVHQQTLLATGLSFSKKKQIVVNTITGKTVDECSISGNKGCKDRVFKPSKELQYALDLAKKTIKGKILKEGDIIPTKADVSVAVTFIYKGSHCTTYYANKKKYVFCFGTH